MGLRGAVPRATILALPGGSAKTHGDQRLRPVKTLARLAVVAAIAAAPWPVLAQAPAAAAPGGVAEQRFADGNDWQRSSPAQKGAFVFGIANALSVGVGWDDRHVPAGQVTFSRRARDGLSGVSVGEVVRRVDAWYAANPGRLNTPVVAVMWLDIAKPRLQVRK